MSNFNLGFVIFPSDATRPYRSVPGGVRGVIGAIGDRETVEFVRWQASGAKYVTSVCTGAFLLGMPVC
jgi:cyclohexyl-isocyanide hydratase